jgi:hypothetical protein
LSSPEPQELGSRIRAHFFTANGGVELDLPDRKDSHAGANRTELAQRFLSGEWGVEMKTFEADQARERQQAEESP